MTGALCAISDLYVSTTTGQILFTFLTLLDKDKNLSVLPRGLYYSPIQ